MTERLVDVIGSHDTVLHTFVVTLEPPRDPWQNAEFEKEALDTARRDRLVTDGERDSLSARMHVSRAGALQP